MTVEEFRDIRDAVIMKGYGDEIDWQTNLKPCDNAIEFHGEACWVILNSGMKEQIARKIWERINNAWAEGKDIATVFKHKGKVKAIKFITDNYSDLFVKYQRTPDLHKLDFLQTIPFIGNITKYHLAKNLGHDCVKPDRHLVRIANNYNTTPDQLCEQLSKKTGEKKSVIDIILWRACNLKII